MAAAIERRRRRVLDKSEERLQKILGIRSDEKSSVLEVDWVGRSGDDQKPKRTACKESDGECKEGMGSSDKVNKSEVYPSQTRAEHAQSSSLPDSSPSTVHVENTAVPKKIPLWIRPLLISLLAVLLITRWTFLNFKSLTVDGDGKDKPGQEERHRAMMEQTSESFIWPFLTLQLVLLCVPQLRQTTHSPRISMLTVALQLSGIPVKLTNFLNLILSFLMAALSDLCFFVFAVLLLHELVINVAPIL